MKKRKLLAGMAAVFSSFFICLSVPVQAKENMVPNYEIKFLLDSEEIVSNSGKLQKDYRNLFETGSSYETISVLYIETEDYDFNNQGWCNRLRTKENSDKFELTYKKRYSIQNGNIDNVLTLANEDGFDCSDTNYKAQIDWGYNKMMLSLSRKKTVSNKGYDNLELPKKSDAINILKKEMPGKENNWLYDGWGKDTIEDGKKCGSLSYLKYQGKVAGIGVDIEIWPVYSPSTGVAEYITEVSFKEDIYATASKNRQLVMNALEKDGVLVHSDSLKTQRILNAYLG